MRSFKKFILLLIIALNAAGSFAQNQKTDFDIANEYYDAGKYEEAINYYERSLQFDIKKYGANHIYIGIDYFFIGLSYFAFFSESGAKSVRLLQRSTIHRFFRFPFSVFLIILLHLPLLP